MKKIGFLKMIYLYSVFWWCVKFKNTCWPINNSSEQTNKQKLWGCACQQGCTARCLNQPANKSTNPNWILTTLWIIEAFFLKTTIFILFCDHNNNHFLSSLSTYYSVDWQWGPHCTPNSLSERNKKKKTKN